VITGYNTDVEYDGVVYHVQTEDKGVQTPIILSLVYVGGAILASKRAPYDDLLDRKLDEEVLAARLQRQHKLICAAVHAGRIEDLKRMSERESGTPSGTQAAVTDRSDSTTSEVRPDVEQIAALETAPESETDEGELRIVLVNNEELRGGTQVMLQVIVSRGGRSGREPAQNVQVTVKTLGTAFAPQVTSAITNKRGLAAISVSLPAFKVGRAAILVRAEVDGEIAELRRIILSAEQ